MRFAEVTSLRSLLVLSTAATLALIGSQLATSRPQPARDPLRRIGDGNGAAKAVPAPAAAPQRDPYADTLATVKGELTACMKDATVDIRLSLELADSGRITSVEVKAMGLGGGPLDVADLDLHVVHCLNAAVTPLAFPRSATAGVRVSTFLPARGR